MQGMVVINSRLPLLAYAKLPRGPLELDACAALRGGQNMFEKESLGLPAYAPKRQ